MPAMSPSSDQPQAELTLTPRFTKQVVYLVTPRVRDRIDALRRRYSLGLGQLMRFITDEGLAIAERKLQDGTVHREQLP